jgi:hypothetical protein
MLVAEDKDGLGGEFLLGEQLVEERRDVAGLAHDVDSINDNNNAPHAAHMLVNNSARLRTVVWEGGDLGLALDLHDAFGPIDALVLIIHITSYDPLVLLREVSRPVD